MNSKFIDDDLFRRVELAAKKKVKNADMRDKYILKMYEELGGRFAVEHESDSDEELEAIIATADGSDSETEELPSDSPVPENAPVSPKQSSDVQVGELKESDDDSFRWMVSVGDRNVHFGASDQPIIWELTGSINRIKARYVKQLDKERCEDPACRDYWELQVLWTMTEETVEQQFELAKDQAEMRLFKEA